jgi:hypothetical protein
MVRRWRPSRARDLRPRPRKSGSTELVASFLVIEPGYVRDVLHGSPTMLALLQATFGVGLLAMMIVASRFGERVARLRIAAAAAAASEVAAARYIGTAVPAVAFFGIGVWGCVTAFFVVPGR